MKMKKSFGLLVRKFHKFLKKQRGRKDKKKTTPKCYGCSEVGHIKPNCPKAQPDQEKKKFPKKQKAYMSWEDHSWLSEMR